MLSSKLQMKEREKERRGERDVHGVRISQTNTTSKKGKSNSPPSLEFAISTSRGLQSKENTILPRERETITYRI